VTTRLLERVASESVLLAAWIHVRDVSGSGPHAEASAAFEEGIGRRIAEISDELRAGTWRPQPTRRVTIPKSDGGRRVLAIPSIRDRVVERAIMTTIDPLVDEVLSPWCFGYRRGLSVNDAINALCEARDDGCTAVLRSDVQECFDQIPHELLFSRLDEVVSDAEVVSLIREIVGGFADARGIAQGSPLSPVLANLLLAGADAALLRDGLLPIRYADDLAIPFRPEWTDADVADSLEAALSSVGLSSSARKTRCERFVDGVHFLGRTIRAETTALHEEMESPVEATVYVASQGALIRSKGGRFRIERDGEPTVSLPYSRTRQVVIVGRVGLTTPFLQRAMTSGIGLVFLSNSGSYFGRMDGESTSNPFLRETQYRRMRDDEYCVALGRHIVGAKIANQRRLLLNVSRRRDLPMVASEVRSMSSIRSSLARATSREELMGIEGSAARAYFGALGEVVGEEWGFVSRRRRPPPDPVNSMLSFGYSILVQELISALHAAGLDPNAPLLHRPRVGRPSLALDMVEEFRPCIVDSVVVRLIRTRQITPDDFVVTNEPTTFCRLNHEARRTMLAALETRMLTVFAHPHAGKRVSWRQAVGWQCRELARVLSRDPVEYRPMRWR
jgi:CRISPR-associated protein Cas1